MATDYTSLSSGSRWHRWEPHIHAPGTLLSDNFRGADAWELFLSKLEASSPLIRALGVTDYYVLESYERVRQARVAGRLPLCELVFPNIEMRLAVGTNKGRWVNLHLLVCPDDRDHLIELKRFMSRLTFSAHDDIFCCSSGDLVRLGLKTDDSIKDRHRALQVGAEQFKVDFEQLRTLYRGSAWAKENILVAVAGGSNDGTSGLKEGADKTLRQELEKFAHLIFASSQSQRDFWLGRKNLSPDDIRRRYGDLKPCLHGSDAHDQESVGVPDDERYSWLKGSLTFDALRQACIDPAARAYVGQKPPMAAVPSRTIAEISVSGAPWLCTPTIPLNPGLIAIVGARGSGKTALADIIAAGCDAMGDDVNPQSFLHRAHDFLTNASVRISWASKDEEIRDICNVSPPVGAYPAARYLTQQFVERLCAADGMTDALLHEIQRVIFESHDADARDGAVSFDELLDLRASRFRHARVREEEALTKLSDRVGIELENHRMASVVLQQLAEKERLIAGYIADRQKLVAKGSEERIARLEALTRAAEKVRSFVRFYSLREQQLLSLTDEVAHFRDNEAPENFRGLRTAHQSSGIPDEQWPAFLADFKGDVNAILSANLSNTRKQGALWKGKAVAASSKLADALIGPQDDLEKQPLSLLEAEIARLQKLVSIDRQTAEKFSVLSRKIVDESAVRDRLKARLEECEGAKGRATQLVRERDETYVRVFNNLLGEQSVLSDLYAPLMRRLECAEGTLRKLSFSVTRVADIARWAADGESLLDLRRAAFKGRGELQKRAEAILKEPWESGTAEDVAAAMRGFLAENQDALLSSAVVSRSQQADYRAWAKRFAQWLYSTDHISVRYSVDYEGVDIRKLSPGTRGIVLLLLYLALDDADDRPLIIDQPEENLDPKSIFDELVELFIQARLRRQVIMITHNANLVVNTDADQVIVANGGPHSAGDLPAISYISGGLENHEIRRAVCDILEGGEQAFRERARRLRVSLQR